MAKKSGYIVNRSNYTLKRTHKNVSGGTVFERDFMSVNNFGGYDSGTIPHEEHNFKMVYRREISNKRKHKYGNWITTPEGNEFWDTSTSGMIPKTTSESRIVLKPNYNSLLDFCYYGSCTELIKSTVKRIIQNYPAELTFTSETVPYERDGEVKNLGEYGYKYLVKNPFDIDIVTLKLTDEEQRNVNPLRYFAMSFNRFIVFSKDGENEGCITSWKVDVNPDWTAACDNEWDYSIKINSTIDIRRYYLNGRTYLLCSDATGRYRSIRPSEDDIKNYFENITDIERALLNKDSIPMYTAIFDYPHETDSGIETYRKAFTWPIDGEWNLDIVSSDYENYINGLLKLSDFYDEHNTNNLWKNMTHDSIKNMDITYSCNTDNSNGEEYVEGMTKMEGLLMACGRQFDEIKRYIDNIKYVNNITYNENNNIPNYFLTDTLNNSGWEVSSSTEGLSTEQSVQVTFRGKEKEYTIENTNTTFLRNLKINSKEILKRKGTIYGIEMLLGLFGLISKRIDKDKYDYEINEYISVIENENSDIIPLYNENEEEQMLPVEKYNRYKNNIETDTPDYTSVNTLQGLPVRMVYFDKVEGGKVVTYKYVIPWFDKAELIDGSPYFQMYGGWGKRLKKNINNSEYPNVKEISGDIIYEETIKYLNIVPRIKDLSSINADKLKDVNNIYYVLNIDDITSYFPDIDIDKATNYFILQKDNIENHHIIGKSEEEGTGWENISTSDINTGEHGGIKVLYLESIIDEYRGNNPHVGYGIYDEGSEFFKYYKQLFKGAIEKNLFNDNVFDCSTGEIKDEIKNIGFKNTDNILVDNKKCWYFSNDGQLMTMYNLKYMKGENQYIVSAMDMPAVDIETKDLSHQGKKTNSVYSADSVVNRKNIEITFKQPEMGKFKEEYINYINKSVLPYLLQVVPSTAILKININE